MPKDQEYPARVSFRATREQARAIAAYAKLASVGLAGAWREAADLLIAREQRRAKRAGKTGKADD